MGRLAETVVLACLFAGIAAAQNGAAAGPAAAKPPSTANDTPADPSRENKAPASQDPAEQAPAEQAPSSQIPTDQAPARHGTVLFQSHGDPPPPGDLSPAAARAPAAAASTGGAPTKQASGADPVPDLSDRERTSFEVVHYDLDLRLQPANSGIEMRADIAVRNNGNEPLRRIPLQISSTLHWEAVSEVAANGARRPLAMVQHSLDTDADHTGRANEGIVTLAEPLAPGALVRLDLFYTGTIPRSIARLRRIGVSADRAATVDWDGIGTGDNGPETAFRGFGNVLWYPVVSPQLFLGSGNELFRAVGAMRKRGRVTDAKLRLRVEYKGERPTAVYFCGRRQEFHAVSDAGNLPVAAGTGVATAEFGSALPGFRTLSLFVVEQPEQRIAPLPPESGGAANQPQFSSSAATAAPEPGGATAAARSANPGSREPGSPEPMLAVETADEKALPALAASARQVAPLLMEWFGARPLSALTILDAPGQPFQDGPLLRAPLASLGVSSSAGILAHSLTAAWVQTGEPWMDEGLGQFIELLWTEQNEGRPTALAQLGELMAPVALAEPALERAHPPAPGPAIRAEARSEPGSDLPGQALVDAESELFYRRKAAAVWWMLRDIAGEAALRQALNAGRTGLPAAASQSAQAAAIAFQRLLERTSGKDLGWFFDDWVLRDRGLPDLTLADVTPRQLPAGQGHDSGWLVAVTVRNDGGAAAEVPLVVRSGSFSSSRRVRIPGFGSATERILVEAPPTEVLLNDGSTPEVRTSLHTRSIVPVAQ